MKIVGFEANGGLHLGVVEGDQVIDLQAVDTGIPSDAPAPGPAARHSFDETAAANGAANSPHTTGLAQLARRAAGRN